MGGDRKSVVHDSWSVNDMGIELSDADLSLMRHLWNHYSKHGNPDHWGAEVITYQDISRSEGIDLEELKGKLIRFESHGWVERVPETRDLGTWRVNICPPLLVAIQEAEKPVPRDYLKEWTAKAKSSRFLAGLLFTFIVALAAAFIEDILRLFGLEK